MRRSLPFLALLLTSCSALRPTRVPPPPGPIPARIPSGPIAAVPPPSKPLPDPPPLAKPQTAEAKPIAPPTALPPTAKPPAPPRRKKVMAKKTPPPAPPAPEPTPVEAPAPEPAPLLQLGEVVAPNQRAELLQQTDALLANCDRVLSLAATRTLTTNQADLLNRVRIFSQRSRDARESSPAKARSLAERARLFADRLLEELR